MEARPWGKWFRIEDIASLPDPEFIVQGFIAKKSKQAIAGEPGGGKTFIVIDLAIAIASGRRVFASHFAINGPAKVAYCAGEKFETLKWRIDSAKSSLSEAELALASDNFRVFGGVPLLFGGAAASDRVRAIDDFVKSCHDAEFVPDLLIIDTLHNAAAGADENDAKDMGAVMSAADQLVDELGCAVLLVHHSPKANAHDLRGSSVLKGDLENVMITNKRQGGGYVSCNKSASEPHPSIGFKLVRRGNSCVVEWTGPLRSGQRNREAIAARVLALLADQRPRTAEEIIDELGGHDVEISLSSLKRTLLQMSGEGVILTEPGGGRKKKTKYKAAKPKLENQGSNGST
jgi:hypothetical protein